MSTVKITQLPTLENLDANTSNSLFMGVDVTSGVTGKFTAHTLAQGLFSNEVLNVGNNQTFLPNTVAQFYASGGSYIQTNLVNSDDGGTADIVVTANTGTDSTYFIDVGFANKDFVPGFEFNNLGTAIYPLDGYLYAQGEEGELGGNLTIGTTTTGTEIKFVASGHDAENIIAKIKHGGLYLVNDHALTFSDGSVQESSATFAESFANGAFIQANSAYDTVNTNITFAGNAYTKANSGATFANASFARANSGYGQANSAAAFANAAFTTANNEVGGFLRANSAYAKANAALANTSGTFDGDLTITGNTQAQLVNTGNLVVVGTANVLGTLNIVGAVLMNATLVLANSNFTATESAVTISASSTIATPSNDGYMIHISGKNGVASRVVTDSYGTGAYSLYAGRAARGTVESPTALQSGDVIARFSGNGYGTTKYQTIGVGRIDFVAAENFTDANTGSQIKFWNCPVGSNVLTNIATFNGDSATFTGHIEPQKGFVYTPTVYPGAQTAITINMTTNSVVRAQTAAGLVVTLSDLLAGKEVVVWITNTAGTNQTFTHGVSALNSSVNATTYSIPGTSTILARYMSIDGTTQNTFVAITHA
jgi:hypothetical protein